jgi:purine-binding chemotaxis protein CheW
MESEQISEEVKPKEEIQLVVFKLADEEYGAHILDIKEIIKIVKITKVPNSPDYVQGIINLRGKIISVIDLFKKFNIEAETNPKYIIIADINSILFGITVESVSEVLKIDKNYIKKAPSIITSKIKSDYLSGVAVLDERLIILLDLKKMLTIEETEDFKKFAEIAGPNKKKGPKIKKLTDEDVEKIAQKHFEKKKK